MLSTLLISLAPAWADTLVVLRADAERWGDPSIGTFYRQGAVMVGGSVVVDLFGPLSLDVGVSYGRWGLRSAADTPTDPETPTAPGPDQSFELLPITVMAQYTFAAPEAPLDPFVGAGFALAHFAERAVPDPTGQRVVRGSRPAIELRAGIRFDLGLFEPSMARESTIKGIDVEIFGGRRIEMPGGPGFDLAAWRGGAGLALRL